MEINLTEHRLNEIFANIKKGKTRLTEEDLELNQDEFI